MKRADAQRAADNKDHNASFTPVNDTRKRKVRGLWQRGDQFYVHLRVDLGNGRTAPRRLALEARNLEKARAEMGRKRTQRRDNLLPQTGHRPQFAAFAYDYFQSAAYAEKKPGTQKLERWAILRWVQHIGSVRVDKITAAMIHRYREARLKLGRTARTANLDTIALRNVVKLALERELIVRLPENQSHRGEVRTGVRRCTAFIEILDRRSFSPEHRSQLGTACFRGVGRALSSSRRPANAAWHSPIVS